MFDHPKVAIFWDYGQYLLQHPHSPTALKELTTAHCRTVLENCSPTSSSFGLGYDIVNNVGRMARVFGSVTTFKAYFDISAQSPKSLMLRSELQSSGVSMIDCPHSGRKEVVDKMILVDMVAFAVDHPAPATIILIAGDRDYAYALSILRLRNYKVILVVPSSPHIPSCLESQASLVIDWSAAPYLDLDPNLVAKLSRELGELPDNSDTSTSACTTSSVPSADLLGPSEFPKSNGKDSLDSTLERKYSHAQLSESVGTANESTTQGLSVPRILPCPRRASVSAPAPMPARARSSSEATRGTPRADEESLVCPVGNLLVPVSRCSSVPSIPIASLTGPTLSALPTLDAHLEPPSHSDGPPVSNTISSPLELGQSTNTIPKSRPDPIPLFNHKSNGNSSEVVVTTAAPAPPVVTHDKLVNAHIGHGSTIHEATCLDDDDGGNEQPLPCRADLDVTPDEAIPKEVHATIPNCYSNVVQDARHGVPNEKVGLRPFDTALTDNVSLATVSVPSTLFVGTGDPTLTKSSAPSRTSNSANNSPDPGVAVSVPSTSSKHSVPLPTTAVLPVSGSAVEAVRPQTWSKFQPLINLLLAARAQGIIRHSRSTVAMDLAKSDPQLYKRVGVSRFRDYTALAETAGVVELGGNRGDTWIALHPSWLEEGSTTTAPSDSSSSTSSFATCSPKTAQKSCTSSPMERPSSFRSDNFCVAEF
ncbi:NYN domain-containing protein [Melanogaster broomeanus]|nr:NYN domain-containing protein [Melanogaster broomeanus]